MSVGLYRKIVVLREAIQWTGDNLDEVQSFTDPAWFQKIDEEDRPNTADPVATAELFVTANNTWVLVYTNDWIIVDEAGYYPCSNEMFHKTFESVG